MSAPKYIKAGIHSAKVKLGAISFTVAPTSLEYIRVLTAQLFRGSLYFFSSCSLWLSFGPKEFVV